MDVFEYFEEELYKIINTLIEENVISVDALESNITVEPPRNYKHGDITSNVAMTLARFSNMKPAELANLIALEMKKVPEVVATAETVVVAVAKEPALTVAVASEPDPVMVTPSPKLPVTSLKVIKPLSLSKDTKVPETVVEPSSLIPVTVSVVTKVPETPVTTSFDLIDKVGGDGDC